MGGCTEANYVENQAVLFTTANKYTSGDTAGKWRFNEASKTFTIGNELAKSLLVISEYLLDYCIWGQVNYFEEDVISVGSHGTYFTNPQFANMLFSEAELEYVNETNFPQTSIWVDNNNKVISILNQKSKLFLLGDNSDFAAGTASTDVISNESFGICTYFGGTQASADEAYRVDKLKTTDAPKYTYTWNLRKSASYTMCKQY